MKGKIILFLLTAMTLIFAVMSGSISLVLAESHEDYCYDQIGDGHTCFETKNKCIQGQQRDDIAESHCYKEDP
jgi:hypothetical protein